MTLCFTQTATLEFTSSNVTCVQFIQIKAHLVCNCLNNFSSVRVCVEYRSDVITNSLRFQNMAPQKLNCVLVLSVLAVSYG